MWKILVILAFSVYNSNQCKYNWQCASLFCQNGICIDDPIQNPLQPGTGSLYWICNSNGDCYSHCCQGHLCMPSHVCGVPGPNRGDLPAIPSEEKVTAALEAARRKIKLRQGEPYDQCDYNFQCNTKCCSEGLCTISFDQCTDLKGMNEVCDQNTDCLSDCCNEQYCSSITQCTDESGSSEPCQFNYQCESSCCSDGDCSQSMYACMDQRTEGSVCQGNEQCFSSCCSSEICVKQSQCFGTQALLREDNPRLAVLYSFIRKHSQEQFEDDFLSQNLENIYNFRGFDEATVILAFMSFIILFLLIFIATVMMHFSREGRTISADDLLLRKHKIKE